MNRQAMLTGMMVIGLALGAVMPAPAAAQNWPTRPVTMVVPLGAGSGLDVVGRVLAPRLSELLGQQVIVENRNAPCNEGASVRRRLDAARAAIQKAHAKRMFQVRNRS